MLERSKFFSQFLEKIEKCNLSLSRQQNKMLKMRSEMLKTRKKKQNNEAGKNFSVKFLGNFSNPRNPEDFRDPGSFTELPGSFLKI